MTRTSGRIVISQNAGEMLNLASKVYAKHLADGAASPLLILTVFNGMLLVQPLKRH